MAKQTGNKSSKKAPLTEFDLLNLFNERKQPKRIEGELSCYNDKYYYPLSDRNLESTILEALREELEELGSARKIKAVAYLVKTQKYEDIISGEKMGLLGFANGVLDFTTWTFWDYTDKNRLFQPITYCLPVSYAYNIHDQLMYPHLIPPNMLFLNDKAFSTPYADQFFRQIANGDNLLVMRIYEMIGYIISPDTSAKSFFLLQGEPNTGKSVLGKFLEGYFPRELVTALDISRLGGQYLPDALATSRLNLSMDLANGELSKKAVAVLKMLTGDDLITHEVKYKDAKPHRGQCKLVFATNHSLKMTEPDKAFLDRVVCIPFRYSIPKALQNPWLLQRLHEERESITMKALFYYRMFLFRNRQFSGADRFRPDVDYHLAPNDTIKEFVTECCILGEGFEYTRDLFECYRKYCAKSKYRAIESQSGFSQRLSALYGSLLEAHRQRDKEGSGENIRGFQGIRITHSMDGETNSDDNYNEQLLRTNTQTINV